MATLTSITRIGDQFITNIADQTTVQFTITFDANVTGVTASNFSLLNNNAPTGITGTLAGTGSTYTISYAGDLSAFDGVLRLSVANLTGVIDATTLAAATQNIATNQNFSVIPAIETISPTDATTTITTDPGQVTFTVTFSETVLNATDSNNYVLSGSLIDDAQAEGGNITISNINGSGSTYNFTVTGIRPHDGSLSIAPAQGNTIVDGDGNALQVGDPVTVYTQINTPPSLESIIVDGSTQLTNSDKVTFVFAFNEIVNFTENDITLKFAIDDDGNLANGGQLTSFEYDPNDIDYINLTPGFVSVVTDSIVTTNLETIDGGKTWRYTVTGLSQTGNAHLLASLTPDADGITDEADNALQGLAPTSGINESHFVDNLILVTAAAGNANEDGSQNGGLTVYRTTNSIGYGSDLAVNFNLTGTALNDVIYDQYFADYSLVDPEGNPGTPISTDNGNPIEIDYVSLVRPLVFTATIAAGEDQTTLPIIAIDDTFQEADQSVILSLFSGGTLPLDSNNSLIVTSTASNAAGNTVDAITSTAGIIDDEPALSENPPNPGALFLPRVTIETVDTTGSDSYFDFPLNELLDGIAYEADPAFPNRTDSAAFFLRIEGNRTENNPFLINQPLTITISFDGGTGTIGEDYNILAPQINPSGPLAISNGQATITVPVGIDTVLLLVTPRDEDTSAEATLETVIATIQPGDVYTLGDKIVAGVTIVDEDLADLSPIPKVSLISLDASGNPLATGTSSIARESDLSRGYVRIQLDRDLSGSQPFVVGFEISGTATPDSDYVALGNYPSNPAVNSTFAVTFSPDADNLPDYIDIPVIPRDDLDVDAGAVNETVRFTLVPGNNYILNNAVSVSSAVEIIDNDYGPLPTLSVSSTGTPVAEGSSTPARFTITRSGGNINLVLPVTYTITGTATDGSDYTITDVTEIAAGQTTATVFLTALADSATLDDSETVILTLNSSTVYNLDSDLTKQSSTITIYDRNDRGTVSVAATTATTAEGSSTSGVFTITRTPDNISQSITVNFSLDGSALPPGATFADYAINGTGAFYNPTTGIGTVTINAGATSTNLQILPINDSINSEGNETVTLTLQSGTNYELTTDTNLSTSATVQIQDNDNEFPLPRVSIRVATAEEASRATNLTVTNPGEALEGTGLPAVFIIELEGNNSNVNPLFNTGSPTEDLLDVTFNIGGTATLGTAETNGDYVIYAPDLVPSDRLITSGDQLRILNIPANYIGINGENTLTIIVRPINDTNVAERDETVQLSLVQGQAYAFGATPSAAVTIRESNGILLPQVSVFVSDAAGNAITVSNDPNNLTGKAQELSTSDQPVPAYLTFKRTNPTGGNLATLPALPVEYTISGTATSLEDYNLLPQSITFAAGSDTVTIPVLPIDDLIYDPNETVSVTINSNSNYTIKSSASSAIVTITDNEVKPTVSLTASGTTLTEGGQAVIYTVTRTGSTGAPLVVRFDPPTGNAQRTVDYSLSNTPGGSVLESPDNNFITLAANQTTGTFQITASLNAESLIDDGEQVILTLANSNDYDLGTQNSTTVTIRDRSDRGNLNLSFASLADEQGAEQNSDPIIFTLTRTGDNLGAITVPFALGGTATYTNDGNNTNDDYSLQVLVNGVAVDASTFFTFASTTSNTGVLNIPAASPIDPAFDTFGLLIPQVIQIRVIPIDDNFIDRLGGSETVTLTLQEGINANYTLGTDLETDEISLTGTIQDNLDGISQLPIVAVTSAATINGVPADSTAFEAQVTSRNAFFTFIVQPVDGNGQIITTNLPTLAEDLVVNYSWEGGSATSGTALAPADYLELPTSFIIPAGTVASTVVLADGTTIQAYTRNLIIEAQDDNEREDPLETVRITLAAGDYVQSTAQNTAVVTIADNEEPPFVPTISIATLTSPTSEGTPSSPAAFRISRTFENNNPALAPFVEDIPLTIGGTALVNNDYRFSLRTGTGTSRETIVPISNTLTTVDIPEGEAFVDILVTPNPDSEVDPNETVTIGLTEVAGELLVNSNLSTATVTIQDTNIVSNVTVSVELISANLIDDDGNGSRDSIAEESDPVNAFRIRRQGGNDAERLAQALAVNLTIGGTATPSEDYAAISSVVVIPVGVDEFVIPLTPIGDTIADTGGDESVVVTIAPTPTNSYTPVLDINNQPSSASVFIIDNENNAPSLNADLLDEFVLNEDAGAVILRNANNRTFAQLIQDAFTDEDINVPENENETLKAIRFITLPASGNLTLDGVLVTENQVVEFATAAEVSEFLDSLRYQPDPDFFGQSEDLQSRPDRFKIVANDGFADSRETDIVINVRPVNDAPFYVLPGEDGFNGGSPTQPNDFYQDSSIIGNLAFSGGDTRNFALRPGVEITIRDFVQGGANEPNPVVGPENERVNNTNSVLPAGNQTLTFSTTIVSPTDIFDKAPTIAADGTLTFKLKDVIPGGFGTAQIRLSAQDNGGTANNGIDTLTKGFFIVTGDENALSNVIQSFSSPVGSTGSLIYNSTAFPVDSLIRVNIYQDVLRLGTSAYLDNIVGLYEIADPEGGIDIGKDLDGDGKITTTEEKATKDGIADLTPNANMSAADRAAYARGALENHLTNGSLQTFNLRAGANGDPNKNTTVTSFNRQGQSSTGLQTGVVLEGGKLYAPFIIANGGTLISAGSGGTIAGAIGTFLTAVNPNNSAVTNLTSPVAYFSFSEVNPDGVEHLRYILNETTTVNGQTQTIGIYGFEDLPGGGDRDYNDAVFGFQFIAPVIA